MTHTHTHDLLLRFLVFFQDVCCSIIYFAEKPPARWIQVGKKSGGSGEFRLPSNIAYRFAVKEGVQGECGSSNEANWV